MSIQDEARAESERRYANRAEFPLAPGAIRNARREAFEKGAAWQASRQPEAAPSDADREALEAVHRQHFYTMTGRCACGHDHHGKPSAEDVVQHVAGAVLAAGFSRSQPVQVEVPEPPCDGGCNYNSGPEETCSAHGRPVAEVWGIVQQVGSDRDRYRDAISEVLNLVGDPGPEARRILSAALGGGDHAE